MERDRARAVSAEGLAHRYRGAADWTFRDVSFAIAAGERLAVLGPNGRGKTTLIKILLGLESATEGRPSLADTPGYVPQSAGSAFAYSVLDMVLMGRARRLGWFGSPRPDDYASARAAIARLELEALEERPFTQLSGGQRQLVLIARAIASEAPTLILDEPTAALDLRNQDVVLRVLHRLSEDAGLTLVFSSHHPQHALRLATHVLMMTGDGTALFGPTAEIVTEDNLSAVYDLPVRLVDFHHSGRPERAVAPVFAA
jgi:iron complex transport system ATP-binding protein